jgi:hypothetical protein
MNKHEISRHGILQIQVCSEGHIKEALDWVRKESPAGTENNWMVDDNPRATPVKCEKYPERTHYLFCC